MPRYRFAGAFDAVAHSRPAAAVVLAKFAQQRCALIIWQCPDVGPSHRRRCDRNSRTDVELSAQSQTVTALAEVNHAETVAAADRDRAAGFAHDFLAVGLGQMPNPEIGKGGIPERHG